MMDTSQTVPDEQIKPKSRGERLFDWLVYGGIGGVGTFIITIPIAFWAKYGRGAERFEQTTEWMIKKGLSEQRAEQVMNASATMQGGNVMVFPIKWAEDNKVALVTKLNDMLGEKTDVAALKSEDKQTWGSIVKARMLAWVTVFTGFEIAANTLGGKSLDNFEKGFAKIACDTLGKETHIGGKETRAFKYGRIAALDVFATAAASVLLYFGSRFFAHMKYRQANDMPAVDTSEPVTKTEEHHTELASNMVQNILKVKAPGKSHSDAVAHQKSMDPGLQLGA
jgi:hypothetical protein